MNFRQRRFRYGLLLGTAFFVGVMSGPLVRSSYRAGRLYRDALAQRVSASVGRDAATRSAPVS